MPLSFDTSRCMVTTGNANCPLAHKCLRRLDAGRDRYQSLTAFRGGDDCDGFIPVYPSDTAHKGGET